VTSILEKLETINPWHFLWIAVIFSEIFTFMMNYVQSIIWWDKVSWDLLMIGVIDAFVVALLVSIIVIFFVNRIRESNIIQKKLESEIKELKGFLPICANCKKIRDDQGFWNQIEEYISKHSNARFSHGICPDCVREHYPEFTKKSKDKSP
jgi:hypothetical protein